MKERHKKNKPPRRLKNILLRSFLISSIVFSVFLVSNCDDLFNHIPIFPNPSDPTSRPPEFGSSASSSFTTALFETVSEGAVGGVSSSAADWAMSALGLSAESPDYTAQLDRIDQDLQEIISQLNGIQNELDQINSELTVINCSEWASQLKDEKSRVDYLLSEYQTLVATASNGGKISNNNVSDWVDQVLAINNYSSQESMGKVLTAFSSTLVGPSNTGVIPACVQSISYIPAEHSFGTDTVYYNQVKLFTNYYYAYQVRALFLYNEARHYQAWVAAGSPNSDYLSADSVSFVCSNQNSVLYCNDAATRTNNLYNSLVDQLTAGGAPYTDENFVLEYRTAGSGSLLWPLSLEDFTTANGDNCADPLISAKPCGITAGFYNGTEMKTVVYKGYKGWAAAGSAPLTQLLAGWTSGTAGDYLQQERGFRNMNNKIIISSDNVEISLNETGANQYVVPFFDTDWDYNFLPGGGGPAITELQFREGPLTKSRHTENCCCDLAFNSLSDIYYNMNSHVPADRNSFYDAYGHGEKCGSTWKDGFVFITSPGYMGNKNSTSGRQFRLPIVETGNLSCTENRSNKNSGGIWTICGDDFTAYLDYYVPRPQTCDNPGAGVKCNLEESIVAGAKAVFGNNSKSRTRL